MKKISLFLPIMATAKKKFHRDPTKIGFFGSPRKKAKLHKILSRTRAHSQTLGRYCSLDGRTFYGRPMEDLC
jgi:hypothetical protein